MVQMKLNENKWNYMKINEICNNININIKKKKNKWNHIKKNKWNHIKKNKWNHMKKQKQMVHYYNITGMISCHIDMISFIYLIFQKSMKKD